MTDDQQYKTESSLEKRINKKAPLRCWRAVYVNSRSEKKILNALLARDVEAYVPIVKTMRQWSDRKKMVELPLLNGYVFVRISDSEREEVVSTRGVISFVRSEGKIALVRDEEINRLKQLVTLGYHLEVTTIENTLREGQRVRINAGALRGLEGVIEEKQDERHLLVALESIGHCIRARLPKELLLATD